MSWCRCFRLELLFEIMGGVLVMILPIILTEIIWTVRMGLNNHNDQVRNANETELQGDKIVNVQHISWLRTWFMIELLLETMGEVLVMVLPIIMAKIVWIMNRVGWQRL